MLRFQSHSDRMSGGQCAAEASHLNCIHVDVTSNTYECDLEAYKGEGQSSFLGIYRAGDIGVLGIHRAGDIG